MRTPRGSAGAPSLVGALIVTSTTIAALIGACSSSRPDDERTAAPSTTTAPTTTTAAPTTTTIPDGPTGEADPAGCPTFTATTTGRLADPAITESSGIASSAITPGVLWTHDDSGGPPSVFATDATGAARGTFTVEGAANRDWEDVAAGPGPQPGTTYLYLGDIGANPFRNDIRVYRVPEPPATAPGTAGVTGPAEALDAVYPEGRRFDAETLMVDPDTADLYLLTKSLDSGSWVFRWPAAAQVPGAPATLETVAVRTWSGSLLPLATGGDISPDGREVAVRTYDRLYLWSRAPGESVAQAITRAPCTYPAPVDGQGESLGFTADGRDLVATFEGVGAPMVTLRRG
jgi:hypothetical protein